MKTPEQIAKGSTLLATIRSEFPQSAAIDLEKELYSLIKKGLDENVKYGSKELIGNVHDHYKHLKYKGWEWRGFYYGWLEGRAEMLKEIKYYETVQVGCNHNLIPKQPSDATEYCVCTKCGEHIKSNCC